MSEKLINELIKRGWEEGHECYYTRIDDRVFYYNIEPNTFSYAYDIEPEEYLGEASLELLEEIENGEIDL